MLPSAMGMLAAECSAVWVPAVRLGRIRGCFVVGRGLGSLNCLPRLHCAFLSVSGLRPHRAQRSTLGHLS